MKQKYNYLLPAFIIPALFMPTSLSAEEAGNEAPNVYVKALNDTVAAGQAAELTAVITEGTAPYTVSWMNGKLNAVGTANAEKASTVTLSYKPAECDLYYVTVTDASGKTASDTCRVIVTGEAVTATFDNLHLDKNSFWCGPDTKGQSVQGAWAVNTVGSFVSGSYQFENTYTPAYGSWTGFAYSNSESSTFSTLADQYNAATAGGYGGSENFAVAYSGGTIGVLNDAEGDSLRGCYITNNAYALNSIVNGDSYSKKFAEGDYLKIVFTGTRADGTTATAEYYLADFRSEKEADRYYLDTWQWADLRQLGKVTSVTFALEGSDTGSWGLNTPAYFCLDDFNGRRVIKDAETRSTSEEVDLSKLFTFDDAEATVTYAIADPLPSGAEQSVKLTTDGKLTVGESLTVVVSATQKGKIQFVRIPFDKQLGVSHAETTANEAETARYAIDGRRIDSPRKGVNIIRTADGKTHKVVVK